ncbi:MAG: LysE family transporter [Candidatus Competibacteraceae bacterium]|nr:LysE family transporter [Candidatus Competibacteraceae bacterium]
MGPLKEVLHPVAGIGLIVLGIGAGRAPSCAAEVPSTSAVSPRSSVLSGLFLTLGDPKALLFYLNFFPAFVGVSQLSGAEILGLLLVVTLTVGGVKIGYAGLANRAQQFFRCARLRKTLNLAAGAILAETGVFLLAFR